MIKNIIFDFDGVIVDSEILAAKAFSKYLKNLGHLVNEEELFNFAGKKTVNVIDTLSEKYQINDKDKFTSDIFEIASKIYLSDLKIVDGFSNYIKNSKRAISWDIILFCVPPVSTLNKCSYMFSLIESSDFLL